MRRSVLILLCSAGASLGQSTPTPANADPVKPYFDPGREFASWNGRNWSITNNRLFDSRFERYLSTPTDTDQDTSEHFKVLTKVRQLLSPIEVSAQSKEEAFRLLKQAADYSADDLISDAISSQVYSAWLAQKNTALLQSATETLEKERKRLEWNIRVAAQSGGLDYPSATDAAVTPGDTSQPRALEIQQLSARLAEVNTLLKVNQIKKEVSWAQARTDFQVLIVQLFLQRRFHHAIVAMRFYRTIFTDGTSQQLKLGDEAKSLFAKATGNAPTLSALESICGQMIGEAHDDVSAFRALLANKEMESATKRLSEAFLVGEYLTSLDVVSMPEKHQALVFVQRSGQLANALNVKDYTLAEKLVEGLKETAKDYDTSKANAAIQTAKTAAAMHLAKARNASASGDKATLEAELNAATEIWPTNPALAETATGIYQASNIHARATAEFDQLVSQRSWRQIYNDRIRFIPALANDSERQARLQRILDDVMMIDRTVERAADLERRRESAGAWEVTEIVYRRFPEYPRLNQARDEYAVKAADYAEAIRKAEELEAKGELGSSLMWYLQAQIKYPPGELAKAGIQRVNHLILPDSW